jgi:hypothetical protein
MGARAVIAGFSPASNSHGDHRLAVSIDSGLSMLARWYSSYRLPLGQRGSLGWAGCAVRQEALPDREMTVFAYNVPKLHKKYNELAEQEESCWHDLEHML